MGTVIHHNFGHPAPTLTKKQIARHWGRTTRWVEQQVKKGMPSRMERIDKRLVRVFPLYECEDWRNGQKGEAHAEAQQSVRSS